MQSNPFYFHSLPVQLPSAPAYCTSLLRAMPSSHYQSFRKASPMTLASKAVRNCRGSRCCVAICTPLPLMSFSLSSLQTFYYPHICHRSLIFLASYRNCSFLAATLLETSCCVLTGQLSAGGSSASSGSQAPPPSRRGLFLLSCCTWHVLPLQHSLATSSFPLSCLVKERHYAFPSHSN